jgi:hypothetical protein
MNRTKKLALTMAVLSLGASALASAGPDPHDRPHGEPPRAAAPRAPAPRPDAHFAPGRPAFDGRGQMLDARYNHGHYYPPVGTMHGSLPGEYRPYYYRGGRYFFSGGVWYAPRGPGFVVIAPPPGIVVSVLPGYYSTVWFAGVPYYYADNVYYTSAPDGGYVVTDPPDNADNPSPPPDAPAAQSDLIIYPKNGQTKDQQAADQFECHNWSKGQTGFDPTQPGGGVAPGTQDVSRSNYNRAMSACLQARGYQVN